MSKNDSKRSNKPQGEVKAKDLKAKQDPKGGLPAVQKIREAAARLNGG